MPLYDAAKVFATNRTNRMKKTLSPEQAQNNGVQDVGAREYINNKFGSQYGLKDSDIGFNNGMVTVKGMDAFKPNRVENGRSFADPNMIDSGLNRVAVQGNLGIPEGYVKARDYINSYGQDYGIDNSQIGYQKNPNTGLNNVMIGGKVVGSGYINPADGRTYIEGSGLKGGIESYAKENGLQNIKDVEKASVPTKYDSATLEKLNLALDKLSNRPKFEYNVENDPKFQALKGLYEKQGQSAFNNALGSMSAMTGGRLNSWAASTAAQAQNAYNEKLMGLVPGMYQNAYNEYNDNYNKDLSNLDAVMKVDNNQYSKFRDTVGDNRNLRDYLSNKMSENKTFNANENQRGIGNMQWDKNFNEGVRVNDRNYNSNENQRAIGNTQWDKTYNAGETQRGFENKLATNKYNEDVTARIAANALQGRSIDVSEGNLGVSRDELDLKKTEKEKEKDSSSYVSGAYSEFASSGKTLDEWLNTKDTNGMSYGSTFTDKELQALINMAKATGKFNTKDSLDSLGIDFSKVLTQGGN